MRHSPLKLTRMPPSPLPTPQSGVGRGESKGWE